MSQRNVATPQYQRRQSEGSQGQRSPTRIQEYDSNGDEWEITGNQAPRQMNSDAQTDTPSPLRESYVNINDEASASQSLQMHAPTTPPSPPRRPSHGDIKRCWICHGTSEEDARDPANATQGEWKSPCKCALEAHEGCLLEWIADLQENRSGRRSNLVKCPQCNTEIRLQQKLSALITFANLVKRLSDATVPVFIVGGLGSMLFVSATVYGVNAVYTLCGTRLANEIVIGRGMAGLNWTWRIALGLPLIPVILIGSRTKYLDAALPILPFIFLSQADPMHLTFPPTPSVTLALLPYIRGAYNAVWERYITPVETRLARSGLPPLETLPGGAGIGQRAGAANDNGILEAEIEIEGQWNGGQVRVNNDIWIDGTKLTKKIAGALVFPGICAAMGHLLGRMGWLRRRIPGAFQRNILGGCLFVVMKDVWRLFMTYKRAEQRNTRKIQNYADRMRQDAERARRRVANGERPRRR